MEPLFRQTMFAEFETWPTESGLLGKPDSAEPCQMYRQLNVDFFAVKMNVDAQIDYEWGEDSPFLYSCFMYISMQPGFPRQWQIKRQDHERGRGARWSGYKKFLSGGCSMTPIELLRLCGVDMSTTRPCG